MNPRDEIAWDELNAYVDGELAPARAAEIAQAVADTPAIARQVSLIARLRAAAAAAPGSAPSMTLPTTQPRRRPIAAAGIAAALIIALATGYFAMVDRTAPQPSWLAEAVERHTEWVETNRIAAAEQLSPGRFLAASSSFGHQPYFPDLSAAQLALERIRLIRRTANADTAIHAGYVGTRGCRISLWIAPARGAAESQQMIRYEDDRRSVYGWQVGGLRYVVVSTAMAADRLGLIAKAAHQMTTARGLPDPEVRTALERSRRTSRPCRG